MDANSKYKSVKHDEESDTDEEKKSQQFKISDATQSSQSDWINVILIKFTESKNNELKCAFVKGQQVNFESFHDHHNVQVKLFRSPCPQISQQELNEFDIKIEWMDHSGSDSQHQSFKHTLSDISWKTDQLPNEKQIKSSKHYHHYNHNNNHVFAIFVEEIQVYYPDFMVSEDVADTILKSFDNPTNFRDIEHKIFDDHESWSWQVQNRDYQFYYDLNQQILYGILTDTVAISNVFCGLGTDVKDSQWWKNIFNETIQKPAYFYQNITEQLCLLDRYKWLRDKCLYGQDNQFNVFKSLCLLSIWYAELPCIGVVNIHYYIRLPIAIWTLVLQILLTVGLFIEVENNWDFEFMLERENDRIIMVVSFMVFSFLSYLQFWSFNIFFDFYHNMQHLCDISMWIVVADFASNVVVGSFICIMSFFYVLQSETISDAILNSFALTFVSELDDMINVFESDDDVLIEKDWDQLMDNTRQLYNVTDVNLIEHRGDYDSTTRRRKIHIPFKTIILCSLAPVVAPLSFLFGFLVLFYRTYKYMHLRAQYVKQRIV
eukprot:156857_1